MRLRTALLIAPLLVYAAGTWASAYGTQDEKNGVVDIAGRWQLNTELSDSPPQPAEGRERGWGGDGSGRRRGGGPPPGGGGFGGGGEMRPPSSEDIDQMRVAMRAVLDAPAEIVVTRNGEEVVFTASGSGDVTRFRVNGQKRKTTAGGMEHEVKASYKDKGLVVESNFGPTTVVDTWRVSSDRHQLVRVTKMEGGRGPGGNREIRRVYDRAN